MGAAGDISVIAKTRRMRVRVALAPGMGSAYMSALSDPIPFSSSPLAGAKGPAFVRLSALFFVQAFAMGVWYVPFSNILATYGLESITPYAFACQPVAAFFSPMFIGSLADQRSSANKVLIVLTLLCAASLGMVFVAIDAGWGGGVVLLMMQIYALCASPTWSLATSIVFSQLSHPEKEFGPIRAWATLGWMASGSLVSFLLGADSSTMAGYAGVIAWLMTSAAAYFLLPNIPPVAPKERRDWKDVLGLEALTLLKVQSHRTVFVTASLLSIPFAAFYPYAARHLHVLGVEHSAAVMSLGQITEAIAMFGLGRLLARFRLRSLFIAGMLFGVVRYGLFALDHKVAVIAGICLHGLCFTLFFIPAQLYLERRIPAEFRARAQSLLTLCMSGVGTLAGMLGAGWWYQMCVSGTSRPEWGAYWSVLSLAVVLVLVYFIVTYRRDTSSPSVGQRA